MKIGDEVIVLFETLGYTLCGKLEELDEERRHAKIKLTTGSTFEDYYKAIKEASLFI